MSTAAPARSCWLPLPKVLYNQSRKFVSAQEVRRKKVLWDNPEDFYLYLVNYTIKCNILEK